MKKIFSLSLFLFLTSQLLYSTNAGDVTIDATSTPGFACPDCPGGTGTKICYEVKLHESAENDDARDFHVEVNSADANKFKCFTAERYNTVSGTFLGSSWSKSFASQNEGIMPNVVNKHYISWYDQTGTEHFNKGDVYKFCVVYCGNANNLDNTIEFIMTNDGDELPAIPAIPSTNRADVPNSGVNDDPGWKGTKTAGVGAGVGFISVIDPEDIPTLPQWGLIIFGLLLFTISLVYIQKNQNALIFAGTKTSVENQSVFNKRLYLKILSLLLVLTISGITMYYISTGTISKIDLFGTFVCTFIVAFIIQIVINSRMK